jgi:hypothetical protein
VTRERDRAIDEPASDEQRRRGLAELGAILGAAEPGRPLGAGWCGECERWAPARFGVGLERCCLVGCRRCLRRRARARALVGLPASSALCSLPFAGSEPRPWRGEEPGA